MGLFSCESQCMKYIINYRLYKDRIYNCNVRTKKLSNIGNIRSKYT